MWRRVDHKSLKILQDPQKRRIILHPLITIIPNFRSERKFIKIILEKNL